MPFFTSDEEEAEVMQRAAGMAKKRPERVFAGKDLPERREGWARAAAERRDGGLREVSAEASRA